MQFDFWPNTVKTVFVREYDRRRFGKWEHVCSHFRRPPR
ncbi:hypothetical protein M2323_000004 [Rhodoblastus acidophilus]|nr:hypothetical protein [Rhodoblastus acidophilus]MCW2331106.1 hypothetical protein [Rhodoblastus acidophilus]